MCQAAPGPRCSNYARSRLDSARAAADAARESKDAANDALKALETRLCPDRYSPGRNAVLRSAAYSDSPEMHAWHAARDASLAAEQEKSDALADYERTPEGQEKMAEAAARLDAAGETEQADKIRQKMAERAAEREQQKADLRIAQENQARLAAALADPVTGPQLAAAQAAAVRAVAEHDQAVAELADADAAVKSTPAEEAAWATEARMRAELDESSRQPLLDAGAKVRAEAKRLYVEAGISDRYAGFYAGDMVDNAREPRDDGRGHAGEKNAFPTKPLRFKTKPSGPDKARTEAAREAAKADPQFQAAKAEYDAARTDRAGRKAEIEAFHAEQVRPGWERRAAAGRVAAQAKYREEDTRRAMEAAVDGNRRLRARVAAGAPAEAVEMGWREAGQRVTVNPDGSINAWVYDAASSPGFPDGRYARAVGLGSGYGQGAGDALVLDSGRKAFHLTHYANYSSTTNAPSTGVLVLPEGGTPLLNSRGSALGLTSVVDSGD